VVFTSSIHLYRPASSPSPRPSFTPPLFFNWLPPFQPVVFSESYGVLLPTPLVPHLVPSPLPPPPFFFSFPFYFSIKCTSTLGQGLRCHLPNFFLFQILAAVTFPPEVFFLWQPHGTPHVSQSTGLLIVLVFSPNHRHVLCLFLFCLSSLDGFFSPMLLRKSSEYRFRSRPPLPFLNFPSVFFTVGALLPVPVVEVLEFFLFSQPFRFAGTSWSELLPFLRRSPL